MVTRPLGSRVWLPCLAESAGSSSERHVVARVPRTPPEGTICAAPKSNVQRILSAESVCLHSGRLSGSARLWRPSGVATRLASFPQPSPKPCLTGVLCSHSKGSIDGSQMQAGVGSCPAAGSLVDWSARAARPAKCQRALPATGVWSVTLTARPGVRRRHSRHPSGKEAGRVLLTTGPRNMGHLSTRQAKAEATPTSSGTPRTPLRGAGCLGGLAPPPPHTIYFAWRDQEGPAGEVP